MDDPVSGGAFGGAPAGITASDDAQIGAAPSTIDRSSIPEGAPSRGGGAAPVAAASLCGYEESQSRESD
jgi:hypothetical protein